MKVRLVPAALCLVVAALAALGSLDARGWRDAVDRPERRVPAADGRGVAVGTRPVVEHLLPGDPVGRVLGLEDDLAYRRAVRTFVAARRVPPRFGDYEAGAIARAHATGALAAVADSGDPRLSSRANDLLGILAASDGFVDTGLSRFQTAILADPANVNAKRNLETLLRVMAVTPAFRGPVAGSGPRSGRGAGSSPPGSGY